MATGFKGQVAIFRSVSDREVKDEFRQVPASDNGRSYGDRGQRGSWVETTEPWPDVNGLRYSEGVGDGDGNGLGFGVRAEDMQRGFCDPGIREDPAFDKINSADRWSEPKSADEDQLNTEVMDNDWEFRGRNRKSRGFLTRPRLPTER